MASKEDLQEVLSTKFGELGVKVSKENAWKLFKAGIEAAVETCIKDKELACSLSGVGRFEIMKAKPRGTKVGVVEFIPRLRFRPSSRINEFLETQMGQVPDPTKRAAVRADLEKAGKLKTNLPPRAKKEPTAAPATPAPKAEKKEAKKADKPAAAAPPAEGAAKGKFEDQF